MPRSNSGPLPILRGPPGPADSNTKCTVFGFSPSPERPHGLAGWAGTGACPYSRRAIAPVHCRPREPGAPGARFSGHGATWIMTGSGMSTSAATPVRANSGVADMKAVALFVAAAMDREPGRKCAREIAHGITGFQNPCPIRFATSARTPNPACPPSSFLQEPKIKQ